VPHGGQKSLVVERLDEEIECARLFHRGLGGVIFMASDEDSTSLRGFRAEVCKQFHSGHVLHPNIEDRDGNRMRRQVAEKGFRFTERIDFKPGGLKNSANGLSN